MTMIAPARKKGRMGKLKVASARKSDWNLTASVKKEEAPK
jgi:hypothetical protein